MQRLKHDLTGDTIEPISSRDDQFRDQPLHLREWIHANPRTKCARRDEGARQSVLLWRDALTLSPLRILRGSSTSLNLNCPSAPPISVWHLHRISQRFHLPTNPSWEPRLTAGTCTGSHFLPPPSAILRSEEEITSWRLPQKSRSRLGQNGHAA